MRTQHTNHGAFLGATQQTLFQLPPPPPGMQWHRTDGWQEGDLPIGYRPHALGEEVDGEGKDKSDGIWYTLGTSLAAKPDHIQLRTTRPLTFTHAGKTWTWHRPGDPMPCDESGKVYVFDGHGEFAAFPAGTFDWSDDRRQKLGANIIGWRYADDKKTVPLGPEDVPPGSVFRWPECSWVIIDLVCDKGISTTKHGLIEWLSLELGGGKINRSIPLTGKWNPDAWEPCSKEVLA